MISKNVIGFAALLSASAAGAQVPAAAVDFSTSPAVPGVWSYRSLPGMSEATFMDTAGGLRLSVRCERANRQVVISRPSSAPAATMFVWTSTMQRSVPARFDPNAVRISAPLHANDPLLDAMAFSRGRFAISIPGAPPLVIAPAPEAARVTEDCRN